jgi:hypothetical protein
VKFDELLRSNPTAEQLLEVARLVPDLRDRAWAAFMKTAPPLHLLHQKIIEINCDPQLLTLLANEIVDMTSRTTTDVNELLKLVRQDQFSRVMSKLLGKIIEHPKASNEILRRSVLNRLDSDRDMAEECCKKILANNPDLMDLKCVLKSGAAGSKVIAAEKLLAMDIDCCMDINTVVVGIIWHAPGFIEKFWKKYRAKLDGNTLTQIAKMNPPVSFRDEVGNDLFAMSDSQGYAVLWEVFLHFPNMREQAWSKLIKIELSETWLLSLKRVAPEYSQRIEPLIEKVQAAERRSNPAKVIISELIALQNGQPTT